MSHPFDRSIALRSLRSSSLPFRASAAGARGFTCDLDESWWAESEPNVGYLAALALTSPASPMTALRSRARSR